MRSGRVRHHRNARPEESRQGRGGGRAERMRRPPSGSNDAWSPPCEPGPPVGPTTKEEGQVTCLPPVSAPLAHPGPPGGLEFAVLPRTAWRPEWDCTEQSAT